MPTRFNPVLSPPFTPAGVSQTRVGGRGPLISPTPLTSTFSSPPPFQSPPASTVTSSEAATQSQRPSKSTSSKSKPLSLGLSCQSPDALSIHTLIKNNTILQTNTLPLHHESSRVIQTSLPSWLISSFDIDPPVELLCVDNDTTTSSALKSTEQQKQGRKILLPLLCVYTKKSVYILQLSVVLQQVEEEPIDSTSTSMSTPSNTHHSTVHIHKGQIQSIYEPFESYLQTQKEEHNDYDLFIQRVRSAPYTHLFNNTNTAAATTTTPMYNLSPFIPRGCIALLISSKKKPRSTGRYVFLDESSSDEDEDDSHVEDQELVYSQMVLYHGIDNDHHYGEDDGIDRHRHRHHLQRLNKRSTKKYFHNITTTDMNTFEPIVDFSFLPSFTTTTSSLSSSSSSSSSFWNGMTIALSTNEGEIYTMTPIVFHGMAIPKHKILDALHYLKKSSFSNEKENENNSNIKDVTAITVRNNDNPIIYRRNKAAMVYIKDVFGIVAADRSTNANVSADSYLMTANIFNHVNKDRNASSWPIAIQGPVYTPSDPCVYEVACLESLPPPPPSLPNGSDRNNSTTNHGGNDQFVCTTNTCGYTTSLLLARGESGQCVQYVMIPSGINCIPRFAFESSADCSALNEIVDNAGSLIEVIFLEEDDDDENQNSLNNNDLYPYNNMMTGGRGKSGQQNVVVRIDPIDNSMIHHFSKFGVVTITTNVLKVMRNRLQNIVLKKPIVEKEEVKTKAWSTIDIVQKGNHGYNDSENVVGVNISGDAKIGHILAAVLSDGKTETINLTAVQYLNEAKNSDDNITTAMVTKTQEQIEADEALRALNEVPLLNDLIKPLLERISSGLSGMSKIVGGSTQTQDITPGTLATFLSMKQSNEQDIIIPMRELHAIVALRHTYLQSVHEHQKRQLIRLKDVMNNLEKRMKATNEKRITIEKNSKILSQKSSDILTTARELAPTITAAEREYFEDIQRYETDSSKFEERLNEIRERCKGLCEGIGNAQAEVQMKVDLNEEQRNLCQALLEGQKQKLEESEITIKRNMRQLQTVLFAKGIGTK